MTVVWVLAALVAVVVVGYALRSAGTSGPRAPRPGEDLPERLNTPLDDDMVLLRVLDAEEAQVVRGLVESNGIPIALRGADPLDMMVVYGRRPPSRYEVFVPADRAEEAEALLASGPEEPL